MAKNLIPIITKELGVEIDEVFRIEQSDYFYRFSKERLERTISLDCEWEESIITIGNLQNIEIIKLPYKPKSGERYWSYMYQDFCVEPAVWIGLVQDYLRLNSGIVFRTQQEAIAARPIKYRELTGREWKK